MRLVVFGWGNELRGDDGLGPLLLRRFADAWPEIAAIEDYQLQIEHALDLEGADCALFIDAGKGTPAPFTFREIAPSAGVAHTTHALAPEAVLAVYAQIKSVAAAAGLRPLRARREFRAWRRALATTPKSGSRRRGHS